MNPLAPGCSVGGRYRVECLLGRGGSAEVYRVRDLRRARSVALKRLAPARAGGDASRLGFEREFYTLNQLRHPNIVAAYDFGHDACAAPFYTMELVRGSDLRQLAPIAWRRGCELVADIASALALIHSRRLVHGDVSARNVRCARGGHATLIDFGTMSSIGAPSALVGTPPHIAPELGTGQPVDQRTDLYALGTLAYWLLAGRHAYPVGSLGELPNAWQRRPPVLQPPSPIPAALRDLVMSMIEPDPRARPRSAAEVLDRLVGIAQLRPRDEPAAARAYLATPPLVQRQPQLDALASALDRAANGHGRAIRVEGEPGLGATRLLRELVLRAKTRGALVLSVAAGHERGAYGVASALARQLAADGGATATARASRHRGVLGALLPDFGESGELAEQPLERRAQLADALCDWFAAAAADRLVVIAVADLHRCDDASLGLLAALAAGSAGARLLLAATLECDDRRERSRANPVLLAGFRRCSQALELRPLDRRGTLALAAAMFGRAPHLERLAEITHELCQGNPALSLELGRHLVDRDLVRYRDGAWSIPQDLAVRDLPSTLDAWFATRVAELDSDARRLAELLAIRGAPTTVDDCVALANAAPDRVFAALDRLVLARIAVVAGIRVSLAQDRLRRALIADLSPETASQLHRRVGEMLAARDADAALRLEAGHHLLRGGDAARGANLVADAATDATVSFASTGSDLIRALEAALAEYDRSGREPRRRIIVLSALVRCAFLFDPSLARYAERTLAALRRDTGLALADELATAAPDEPRARRLQRAVMLTAQRHTALAPERRGLDVFEAATQLLLTGFSVMGVGINQLDLRAVQRVADVVEPLAALGLPPALATHRLLLTVVDAMRGRQVRAQAGRREFIAALADPAVFTGINENRRRSLIAAQLHGIGMLESLCGGELGLRRADELDAMGLRTFAPAAAQIRVLTHLFNGDERRANACRGELDMLALRHTPAWQLDTWILPYLAGPYDLWGDVIGLKHAVDQLRGAAARYPGFEPFHRFALGAYHRERGELAAALAELETALRLAPPGVHVAWSPAIAAYVHALVRAGYHDRARDEGERAIRRARADGLAELWVRGRIEPALAIARARRGDAAGASQRLDAFLRDGERDAMPRPMLGKAYEARATLALEAGDRAAFTAAAQRAGALFLATGNAKLIAGHERLVQAAADRRPGTDRAPHQRDLVTA